MEELRARYAELWARRERARAAFRSGRSARLELERLFDELSDITAGEPVERLAREHQAARFEAERESARRLLRGVQARVLEARTLSLEREVRSRARAFALRVGKQERPAFDWLRAAPQLDSAEARGELQRGLDRMDAELGPLRAEWRERRAGELAKLGFATPCAWAEALRPDAALDAWRSAARELLVATEAAWHDALRSVLAGGQSGAPQGAVDLARVLSLPRWAGAFRGPSWDALDSLTDAWRVRLRELPGIALDESGPAGADPQPFLVAPRVPQEILLVLAPRAGLLDLPMALSLGGRALALAFASDSLPIERRVLGDRALGLAWGELIAQRLADPAWLDSGPLAAHSRAFASEARALELARARFAAARTIAELDLADLPPAVDPRALADAHAQRMREALGCEWTGHALLRDCRAEPAAVDELRAACFAAQLAEHLRERYGRAFWRARACGELLKELWHTGTTYTPEELAAQLGIGPLSIEPLRRPAG